MGEVIIAKHRNGSLETVQLKFIGKYTKFADLDGMGGGFDSGYQPMGLPASTFDSEPATSPRIPFAWARKSTSRLFRFREAI